jgi:hypothetical protein
VLQGVVGGMVGAEFGIEIAQDSYANGIGHIVILINGAKAQGGIAAGGLEGRCQRQVLGVRCQVLGMQLLVVSLWLLARDSLRCFARAPERGKAASDFSATDD